MNGKAAGFSIPFRIDTANGGVAKQNHEAEKLKENLIHIIMTGVGERAMRRSYGGGVRQLLHDPLNDTMRAIVQHQISKAITKNEPRILLQGVEVVTQDATIFAEITYLLKQTRQTQSLSVPLGLGGI